MSKALPNVSEAYYLLLQEEHKREMSSCSQIVPELVAFNSNFQLVSSVGQDSLALMGNNYAYGGRHPGFNGRNVVNNCSYNNRYNCGYNSGYNKSNSGY